MQSNTARPTWVLVALERRSMNSSFNDAKKLSATALDRAVNDTRSHR